MIKIDDKLVDRIARTICYSASIENYEYCIICDPDGNGLGKESCIMVEQFRYEAIEVIKELMEYYAMKQEEANNE